MAKEQKDKELEITSESDETIDVKVENEQTNLISKTKKNMSFTEWMSASKK